MLKDVLERQQAQLKIAEKQLKKAERDAAGRIMCNSDDKHEIDGGGGWKGDICTVDNINGTKNKLKMDLAQYSKPDGCWDDNDAWDNDRNTYQTFYFKAVDVADEYSSAVLDAWDL